MRLKMELVVVAGSRDGRKGGCRDARSSRVDREGVGSGKVGEGGCRWIGLDWSGMEHAMEAAHGCGSRP